MTPSARPAKGRRPRSRITPALRALRRAARAAYRLSVETGTPFYVWKDGKVVDLLAKPRKKGRRQPSAAMRSRRQRRRKARNVAPSR